MGKRLNKITIALLSSFLIPIPFLFHWYEYHQHVVGKEASFLAVGFVLVIVLAGIAATQVNMVVTLLLNGLNLIFSLILASMFLPLDPYWFTVVGRNGAVVWIWIVYVLGQLLVKGIITIAQYRQS
ncbi:hypothetical protein [Anoxybacteroides tepidamans]|uniref:hypothetical protein n=1 Tax=Anoxybacteroides tepidamans TaxID=265948 RepID=UPI0012EC99AA|nr:hypothetical protein [Anoxybacillus tepidamans]